MDSRKDPDLGKKLAHLAGVMGASVPAIYTRAGYQARQLGISDQQMSHKKRGRDAISNAELSHLVEIFSLRDIGLDYRLFLLPFDEFEAMLRKSAAGTYGLPLVQRIRKSLIDAADPKWPITICKANGLRGGIGSDASSGVSRLSFHDQVYLLIPIPGDGHLLLLNDSPEEGDVSCLMPSCFAAQTEVGGNSVRIPLAADASTFPVGGPIGLHRLFAIWSPESNLRNLLPHTPSIDGNPTSYSMSDLRTLARFVDHDRAGDGKLAIRMVEYLVQAPLADATLA